MKELENKILTEGKVIDNSILKVDSFFNYCIDISMLRSVGKFIASHFKNVDKVLTIEASGIAFAVAVAFELGNVPVIFAKKSKTAVTSTDENYIAMVHSFTHGIDNNIYVSKRFLNENDNVLIVDDFLANGAASIGLVQICQQAKANVVGVGIGIEKEFQGGRKKLQDLGCKIVSAARITAFENNKPIFSTEKY